MQRGSLVCVGVGIYLGAHITELIRQHIQSSDVCFVAVSDALTEVWISEMHPDVRSLQIYYAQQTSRKDSYRAMIDAVIAEVKLGKKVCGIFYGHPGVFAYVTHQMLLEAKGLGCKAIMEPGISAEDCLIADLAIDPGKYGCQQYEATQLIIYHRVLDPSAYLFLWQIGVVGDLSYGIDVTGRQHRELLLTVLYQYYPKNHAVILYEAATSPMSNMRKETIKLSELGDAVLNDYTTLVIPPSKPLKKNSLFIKKLQFLAAE